jgi:hypothetical protein
VPSSQLFYVAEKGDCPRTQAIHPRFNPLVKNPKTVKHKHVFFVQQINFRRSPMNKRISTIFFVMLAAVSASAQRTANISYGTGVVNYIGDLGNEKNFAMSSANIGMEVTVRDFLNNPEKSHVLNRPFGIEARFSWHRLQYDETKPIAGKEGVELRNYHRGLNFRNDLFGISANATYTHYANRYRPLYKQRFAYFILAGVGAFYGTPKADLFKGSIDLKNRYYYWNDGTIRDVDERSGAKGNVIEKDGVYETNLHDWHTEGQGKGGETKSKKQYSTLNVGFPLGVGIRYGMNKNITISAELDYYYFITDYLDDVSERYATYDELAANFSDPNDYELSKYITDPTGYGSSGEINVATSPRGNPQLKDAYTFFSIEIAYKIQLHQKGVYGTLAKN